MSTSSRRTRRRAGQRAAAHAAAPRSHRWQPARRATVDAALTARAGRSRRRRAPARRRRAAASPKRAALAIIAALSVHSARGGTCSSAPERAEPLAQRPRWRRRRRRSPAAPQARLLQRRARRAARAPRRSRAGRTPRGRARRSAAASSPSSRTVYSSAVFRPAKEKSRPATRARDRERRRPRGSPSRGQALERRAAGERQAEHPRALVERLAGGVVERRAEHLEAVVVRRRARGTCGRRWRRGTRTAARTGPGRRKFAATWPCRWSTAPAAGRARRPAPWPWRARRAARRRGPGPGSRRPARRRRASRPARASASSTTGVDQLEVVARGDLRDDAAEAVVDALRGDDVRADLAVGRDDGRAGVVAAGLDARGSRGGSRRGERPERHGPGVRDVVERAAQRRRRAPHDQRRPRRCPGSSGGACPAARKPKRS